MAGQTSPVGLNESLAEAKTLWIGDLAYWCDETWLTSLFVGACAAARGRPVQCAKEGFGQRGSRFSRPAPCCSASGGRPGPPIGPQN